MSQCRAIDIMPLVASSYGASGMCPAGDNGEFTETQQQELLLAINQSLPMGLRRLDAQGTLTRWEVPVYGGVFTLPPDCLDVRQAFLNGCSLTLRDMWYEGQIGHRLSDCKSWCGSRDLMDMGDGFAIPEEWPSQHQDIRLGFLAESDEDAEKQVQVKFRDKYGHIQEEYVTALGSQQVASTETAISDVLYLHKGVTKGAYTFFIMYPNGARVRLMRVPANVVSPSYHKKKLPAHLGACTGVLSIIGKMRFFPLTSVTDTLPICDPVAISFLFQALHHMKNRELQSYNDALTLFVNEANKILSELHPAGVVTQMSVRSPIACRPKCWN